MKNLDLILRGFCFFPFKEYGGSKSIMIRGTLSGSESFIVLEPESKESTFSVELFFFEKEKELKLCFSGQKDNVFNYDSSLGGYVGILFNSPTIVHVYNKESFNYKALLSIIKT